MNACGHWAITASADSELLNQFLHIMMRLERCRSLLTEAVRPASIWRTQQEHQDALQLRTWEFCQFSEFKMHFQTQAECVQGLNAGIMLFFSFWVISVSMWCGTRCILGYHGRDEKSEEIWHTYRQSQKSDWSAAQVLTDEWTVVLIDTWSHEVVRIKYSTECDPAARLRWPAHWAQW